jgi:methyltransferase
MVWYLPLLFSFALLRVIELYVSHRHQARLLREGGYKVAEPLYPLMISVHASLFIGSALEVWGLARPFLPFIGWPMLSLLSACMVGRIWIWRSLGEQWNTQIVTSPRTVVDTGPYRYVRHPNYAIVILEMFALPLAHCAYLTAVGCSVANALILWRRIQLEEAVLLTRPDYAAKMAGKPRFLPAFSRGR